MMETTTPRGCGALSEQPLLLPVPHGTGDRLSYQFMFSETPTVRGSLYTAAM